MMVQREKMKSNNIVDDGKERRRGKMGTKFIMWCREREDEMGIQTWCWWVEKTKWGKKRLTMLMIREDEM
jgi:hypothetical protein